MSELTDRQEHIQGIKDIGQDLIDNAHVYKDVVTLRTYDDDGLYGSLIFDHVGSVSSTIGMAEIYAFKKKMAYGAEEEEDKND